jgi:hypothetical protein
MRPRRARAKLTTRLEPEQLSTEQIVELHERLYAPLDAAARARIVAAAHLRGWDRPWAMDGLAA